MDVLLYEKECYDEGLSRYGIYLKNIREGDDNDKNHEDNISQVACQNIKSHGDPPLERELFMD